MALTEAEELELLELEEAEYQASKLKTSPPSEDSVSVAKSVAEGGLNGLTLGFRDELGGGLEAVGQAIGIKGLGKNFSDIGFQTPNGFDSDKFQKAYEETRNERRKISHEAEDANPRAYLAGEIGGGIVNSAATMPFMGSATSLGARAVQGAGLGSVAAYGGTDDRENLLQNMGVGAAIGGAAVPVVEKVVVPAVGKSIDAASKVSQKVKDYLLKKGGKAMFGVDEKATQNYLQNPKAVNKAYSMGELADSVLNQADDSSVLSEMKNKVSGLASEGWDDLSTNTNLDKQDLLKIGDEFANTILKGKEGNLTRSSATGADKRALEAIYKELDNIQEAYGDNLSETDLKSIVQSLQNMSYGSDTFTADRLKQLSGVFNDTLKKGNKEYASTMTKTQESVKALNQVKSIFQNRQNPENYDKFTKAVKNLVNKDEMSAANKAVNKIKEHTGYDLGEDITNSWTKQQFEKGDVNGSRNTLFGTVVGGAVGSFGGPVGAGIGGAIGAGVGRTVDKYSGPIFKKLLDGNIAVGEFTERLAPRLGKYAQPLSEAIKRGPAAVNSTIFLLQQNNPEFRQMMKEIDEESQ